MNLLIKLKKNVNFFRDCILSFYLNKKIIFYIKVGQLHDYYKNYSCEEDILPEKKFGIILQGPLVKNFTIDTAIYYKYLYKNQEIFISTDTKLSYSEIKILEKHRIPYEQYEPIKKNLFNLASQSYSVSRGINYLKKKKISYVLKTRSDQRCLNPQFLNNIYFWYRNFNQNKKKILFSNLHSHLFWPFDIPDYFIFSTIKEVKSFFSINELDIKKIFNPIYIKKMNNKLYNAKTNLQYSKLLGGGSYFCINYLKKKYKLRNINFNLRTYYNYLSKDFIVIDSYSIGLIWNKYNYNLNRDHPSMFSEYYSERQISIYDWIKILKGKRKFVSGKEVNTKKVSWIK